MPKESRIKELIRQVEQGNILAAIEEFYAPEVVMQENRKVPTIGIAANIEREKEFLANLLHLHESRAVGYAATGDNVAINWILDFTTRNGNRVRVEQVSWQLWKEDRIIQERFFYDSASVCA